jgi:DNA modification methylase
VKHSFEIINGDCRKVLRTLERGSCALLLTDVPYSLGDGETEAISRRGAKSIRRDFGDWDKGRAEIEHLVTAMAQTSAEVVHRRGGAYVFTSDILLSHMRDALEVAFGITRAQTLTWCKTNPAPSVRQAGWTGATEFCVWGHRSGLQFSWPGHAQSFSWMTGPTVHNTHRTHPTEKPVWLWQRIISATTQPGDVVLDPFAGTGSSGEAALRLGRRWVGIELDERHAATAARRLEEVARALARKG